jgi:hypothetical protein
MIRRNGSRWPWPREGDAARVSNDGGDLVYKSWNHLPTPNPRDSLMKLDIELGESNLIRSDLSQLVLEQLAHTPKLADITDSRSLSCPPCRELLECPPNGYEFQHLVLVRAKPASPAISESVAAGAGNKCSGA